MLLMFFWFDFLTLVEGGDNENLSPVVSWLLGHPELELTNWFMIFDPLFRLYLEVNLITLNNTMPLPHFNLPSPW